MTPIEVLAAGQLQGATVLESLLAQAYVRRNPERWEDYQFNFRLGSGLDPGPNYEDGIRRMNILLTQKRVDMVTRKGGLYGLWELKARAGLSALGQLLGYAAMWEKEGRPTSGLTLGIITRLVDADVSIALVRHNIAVELFD